MGSGKSALQASLRCRFPEAHARISGAVPQISLLSQTAAIARSSRIYWVFISGSRASGIFVAKYFFRNGKKFRLFYAAIILPLPL